MGVSDSGCGAMHESSSAESTPEGGLEGLLESGGTNTKHGSEAEVQSDKGGGGGGRTTDSASEKEGEATTVRGTETASVFVREAVQDRSLSGKEEGSDGKRREFNSVCEVVNKVVLQVG